MIQRGWAAGRCTRYPVVAHSGPVFGVAVLDPAISSQRDDDGGGDDDEEGFLSLTAVSVGADGQMIVWGPMGQTLRPKVEVGAHRGGSEGVLGLAVDHTNGLVFTGSMLGEIRAWSVGPDPATPPSAAAVPGEGGRGGRGGGGGGGRHDSTSPEVRHQRRGRVGGGGQVEVDVPPPNRKPSGAARCGDDILRLEHEVSGHATAIVALAFGGGVVASASHDGTAKLWTVRRNGGDGDGDEDGGGGGGRDGGREGGGAGGGDRDGAERGGGSGASWRLEPRFTLQASRTVVDDVETHVESVALSMSGGGGGGGGGIAATGGRDTVVRTWDIETGTQINSMAPLDGWIWGLSLQPQEGSGGALVVASTVSGTVALGDLRQTCPRRGRGWVRTCKDAKRSGPIGGIAVDWSRFEMVTSSFDGSVRLWDLRTFRQIVRFAANGTVRATPPCEAFQKDECGADGGAVRWGYRSNHAAAEGGEGKAGGGADVSDGGDWDGAALVSEGDWDPEDVTHRLTRCSFNDDHIVVGAFDGSVWVMDFTRYQGRMVGTEVRHGL